MLASSIDLKQMLGASRAILLAATALAITGWLVYAFFSWVKSSLATRRMNKKFPMVALDEDGLGFKQSWFKAGPKTIAKGLRVYNERPFQVMTGTGPKIVLANKFADELKNIDREDLSLVQAIHKDFMKGYTGFSPFASSRVLPELIRTKLTPALGIITVDLIDETTAGLHDLLGDDPEWQEIQLKDRIVKLIARLSSRMSLGLPRCRDEHWLELTSSWTVQLFSAARELRQWPAPLRFILQRLLPEVSRLRKLYFAAQDFIGPEIARRVVQADLTLQRGEKPRKTADMVSWLNQLARGRKIDYVDGLLEVALASIHTSTEAVCSAILDIADKPEVVQQLREEIITHVRTEGGFNRQALSKMGLLDSFLKESQRFHPPNSISMNRLVKKPLVLSDGSLLPVGARILVAGAYDNPAVYENPEVFEAGRFLRAREREKQGQGHIWQHVSTSPAHMGFGHGTQSCPARFFASAEIKIVVAHLLLKYDWRQAVEGDDGMRQFETTKIVRPDAKMLMRRREEEVVMDLPAPMVEQTLDEYE